MAKAPTAERQQQENGATEFVLDPSLFPNHQQPSSTIAIDSSTIREREKSQLRVVAQGLAPELVLDQPLSVPNALPTLRGCLAEDAPLLPISVLRACLNEASTNALFSSATSLDASQEETTRLLNEVDSFQSTVLGLLDEVERRYTATRERQSNGKGKGVKRELEEEPAAFQRPKKYMLHRGGANGGDLFTSSAFLSDRDLEQVSLLHDADLVAVHPPSSTSSSFASAAASSAPTLGSVHPPFPPPSPSIPVSLRYSLAPGQSPSLAPHLAHQLLPPVAPRTSSQSTMLEPLVRETKMLDYGVWSSSLGGGGNGIRFDSQGSTDGGYWRAANRLVGREKLKKWDKALLEPTSAAVGGGGSTRTKLATSSEEEEEEDLATTTTTKKKTTETKAMIELNEKEKLILQEMEIELTSFFEFAQRAQRDEEKVWKVLERNLELLKRLGGAQIARTRKSGKREEKKSRKKKFTTMTATGELGAHEATAGIEGEEEGEGQKRDLAEGIEKQDADALLASFTSLLSSFYSSSVLPSTTTTRSAPSLLPSPSLIRSLTPLIVGELHRESSYHGGLEPVEGGGMDLKSGWEKAVKESSMSHAHGTGDLGTGMIKQE